MADGNSGEKLGTAYVNVEARLDQLKADLADVERETMDSMNRVKGSSQGAAEGVEEVGAAAESSGALLNWLALIASLVARAWGVTIGGILRGFGSWAATTTTLGVLLTKTVGLAGALARAFAPLAILSAALHAVNLAIEGINAALDIGRNIARLWSDAFSEDAKTARNAIREIGDELSRIPLLGEQWAAQMKIIFGAVRGDMDLISEGFGDWRSYLLGFPVLGWAFVRPIDSTLQSVLGIREQMEGARDAIFEAEKLAQQHAEVQARTHSIIKSITDTERDMQNRLTLERLDGVEKVREAERQRHEEAMRQARLELEDIERQRNEHLENLQKRSQVGEDVASEILTESEGEAILESANIEGGMLRRRDVEDEIASINEHYNRIRRNLENQIKSINEASAELRARGVEAAGDEERRAMLRAQDQLISLQMEMNESRLRLQGREFEARAEGIRRQYRSQILEAERDGEEQRARLMEQIRDQRIAAVWEDSRAEAEARIQAQREAGERVQDELRDIEREIMREQIADDAVREAFDIGTQFADRIDAATDKLKELRAEMDALREGGTTNAEQEQLLHMSRQLEMLEMQRDRLRTLRNLRLEGIDLGGGEVAGASNAVLAREIGRDRIVRGEGRMGEVQEVRDKKAEQQRQEMIEAIREDRVEFG